MKYTRQTKRKKVRVHKNQQPTPILNSLKIDQSLVLQNSDCHKNPKKAWMPYVHCNYIIWVHQQTSLPIVPWFLRAFPLMCYN